MSAEVHGEGERKAFEGSFADDILSRVWARSVAAPQRAAFINAADSTDRVTFGEFYTRCASIAAYLQSRGFGQRDVACVMSAASWEYAAAFVGVAALGGVVAGVYTHFNEGARLEQLTEQFNKCGPKVLFADAKRLAVAHAAAHAMHTINKPLVVRLHARRLDGEADALPAGVVELRTAFDAEPRFERPPTPVEADKDVLMLATSSGTTAAPKQVMITHANVGSMLRSYHWHDTNYIHASLSSSYDAAEETLLIFQPPNHISWLLLPLNFISQGTTVVVMGEYKLETLLDHIQEHKIKRLHCTPPVVQELAESPLVDNYDLASLRLLHCGGTGLRQATRNAAHERLKVAFTQDYGQTETSWICFRARPDDSPSSSGRLLGAMEAKIVDVKTRKTLIRGQYGEIMLRGSQKMAGYLHADKATKEAIDKEGWYKTSDYGCIDSNGCIHIVDRLFDCFYVDDNLVAPAELDEILAHHPAIEDAATIGVADAERGAIPKAFVVRRDDSLVPSELHEWFNSQLKIENHAYKRLDGGIEFVERLERTPAGKILRRNLRDRST